MKTVTRVSFAMAVAFLSLMVAAQFAPIIGRFFHWEFLPLLATTIFAITWKLVDVHTPEIHLNVEGGIKRVEKMQRVEAPSVEQVIADSEPRQGWFKRTLVADQMGQDIAEYAVMLAVILIIVVGTIQLIGSNANNTFSAVASSIAPNSGKP